MPGQIPVIEQAIDTAAPMLGSDKSRGYCLEMICADFLAGAQLGNGDPEILLNDLTLLLSSYPASNTRLSSKTYVRRRPEMIRPKAAHLRLDPASYESLRTEELDVTDDGN